MNQIVYSLMNPTGNITALVESDVDAREYLSAASAIMDRHPEVEQVGFVQFNMQPEHLTDGQLRMAGGEFCGNASMSTAALYLIRSKMASKDLLLSVSGVREPVRIHAEQTDIRTCSACVEMPPVRSIDKVELSFNGITERLPIINQEGISHLIIEPECAFSALEEHSEQAEKAVRQWCAKMNTEGLGLMFLRPDTDSESLYHLRPLVYIPAGQTIFWEHSCASGSAAAGRYLAEHLHQDTDIELNEPGGLLRVVSHLSDNRTLLYGKTSLIGTYNT